MKIVYPQMFRPYSIRYTIHIALNGRANKFLLPPDTEAWPAVGPTLPMENAFH